MSTPVPALDGAEGFREEMIDHLVRLEAIRSPGVEAAFRAVPRHRFLPELPVADAYDPEDASVTKRDRRGTPISSVSAPHIQALMLEQARIRPGMRVLEIGSGGYNAALLAELVGPTGAVTTIDIDRDVVDRAACCLAAAGYGRVNVVRADGEHGEPRHAPYDRIVVTVQAADLPPAWTAQLAGHGRIVVPLRLKGLTRSVAFDLADDGHLSGRDDYEVCGFVSMQGTGALRMHSVLLHDTLSEEVALRVDGDAPRPEVVAGLRAALALPRAQAWSGVSVGGFEPLDDLDLWLASRLPDFALLTAKRAARDRDLVATSSRTGVPTLLTGDGFAYRVSRPYDTARTRYGLGACGHGPQAEELAHRLVGLIRTWGRDHRTGHARFDVYPADTPDAALPDGPVITRAHTRTVISWPTAA
jgi:protein-L-isoaspartate(D-aspartate) O-methyltransferase